MFPQKIEPMAVPGSSGTSGTPGPRNSSFLPQNLTLMAAAPAPAPNPLDLPKQMTMSPNATFHDLSDELKLMIFSYLTTKHTLTARRVCRDWDARIRTWDQFVHKLNFPLSTSLSLDLLQRSEMEWQHIITQRTRALDSLPPAHQRQSLFSYFEVELGSVLKLAPGPQSSISTMELTHIKFTWLLAQEFLNCFPALLSLTIKNCELEVGDLGQGFLQSPESCEKAVSRRNQLKSLSLDVKLIDDLVFYLTVFRVVPMLTKLEIFHGYAKETLVKTKDQFLAALTTLLRSCQFKLKDLSLAGSIIFQRIIVHWLSELKPVSKIQVDLTDLSLITILDPSPNGPTPTGPESNELSVRSTAALMGFLKTQTKLQHIEFPLLSKNYKLMDEHMASLSLSTIKNMSLESDYLLNPGFFKTFKNLEEFKINTSPTKTGTKKFMDSVRYQDIKNMKTLTILNGSFIDLSTLTISFRNLTKLDLEGESNVTDIGLQAIIKNLIKLQSLSISVGTGCLITDYGVTGIPSEECKAQFESRRIYVESINYEGNMKKIGVSLCTLRNLKVFKVGKIHLITDVGIYYGFDFDNLREVQMSIGDNVTIWGIEQLGKKNRNLEKIKLHANGKLNFWNHDTKSVLSSTIGGILPSNIEIN